MSKLLKAFEFDCIRFSDSYFENENNIKKILDNGTTKTDLIKYGLAEAIKNINTSKERVLENDGVYEDFPCAIDLQITTVYCPDKKYLTNVVELFELLAEPTNKEYLDYVILYDTGRFWGNSKSHSRIVSILAADNKYFVCDSDSNGNRKILDPESRFTGVVPYLFNNGYRSLYERMIKVVFKIAKDYSFYVGKMILSLYNFLKLNDATNFELFNSIYKNIVKDQLDFLSKDASIYSKLYFQIQDIVKFNNTVETIKKKGLCLFTVNDAISEYGSWFGNGFEFKKEYANYSFAELLE